MNFWLLLACTTAHEVSSELIFLRHAVVAPQGESDGQALSNGREIIEMQWLAGEEVSINGLIGRAPLRAECQSLFTEDLGDIASMIALRAGIPNTDMAWSPDENLLAVGSHLGEVLILNGWDGTVIHRRHLAESMVKYVAWSPDGRTLYAAEQSPDAFVYAFDSTDWSIKWKFALSEIVERSMPPAKEDVYGVYTLPSAFGLNVLSNGDLIVPAVHAWKKGGERVNLSQLLRISKEGQIVGKWPKSPMSITIKHPRIDEESDRMLVSIERTAEGEPPSDLPIGGVQILRLSNFEALSTVLMEPLKPWFEKAMLWEGLDLSSEHIFLGFSDGRAMLTDIEGTVLSSMETGAPIMAGDVPIHAIVGWGRIEGDKVLYNTSSTHIPYGAASPELRPPSMHPNENGVFVHDLSGKELWKWQGDHYIQGLSVGEEGRTLVVGAGDRQSDERRDLYGAVVFDVQANDRSGIERLEALCMTKAPVFFRHSMTSDGRIALAEHPYVDSKGSVHGRYQVNVMR